MTNELIIPLAVQQLITKIEDRSDTYMQRLRITFTNGYGLSIIRGEHSYGNEFGVEIAPFNPQGKLDGSLFDEDDQGDDVLGWCDQTKVNHYLTKLSSLPKV